VDGPGERPTRPVGSSPARRPSSIRRTTSINISANDDASLHIVGRARDLRTVENGACEVADAAEVDAVVETDLSLRALQLQPDVGDVDALRSEGLRKGFRKRVAARFAGSHTTALSLLLDDLPVGAVLLAGYARLRESARPGSLNPFVVDARASHRMADVCSGWRSGGTLLTSLAGGAGIPLQTCPDAPNLVDPDDADGWHAMDPLAPGTMRRVRRIDVVPNGAITVDSMFRDSYGEPDGREVVLHEYGVRASFDHTDGRVLALVADPHVLPYGECPAAALSVIALVGRAASDLSLAVAEDLSGIAGCTHLNDLLRSLASVPALATAVR
jgi:hypothetical protein